MKFSKLFQRCVDIGIDADVRGRKQIEKTLKKEEKRQAKLEGKEKEFADNERTWNPYSDCRIINGNGNEEIKRLVVGIDIETPEMLLIDRLRAKGEKIDGVLIHHPEGRALADLDKVMDLQVDVLASLGVPVNHSEAHLRPRQDRVWRSIHADNLFRVERAAELLDIPLFGCHTITDNMAWSFMEKEICGKSFDTVGEIMDALLDIPEYAIYAKKGNPPILVNGRKESRPGKIFATEFTGGTNGPEELVKLQAEAGVGTILSMHATEKTLDAARDLHVNIIQCSHMASDALGVNLLIDEWQKKGAKLEILPISGFVRVERKKK